MGLYTEYWESYRKRTIRGTLYALAVLGFGVPAIAAFGYLLAPLDNSRTALLLTVIVVWLAGLVTLVLRHSRVVCPRCQTRYSRGKFAVNCPQCGLRMLQEEP